VKPTLKHLKRLSLFALLGLLLTAGIWWLRPAPAPLPHDAYIWQMRWNPSVREAITENAALIRSWRVLLAQADRTGRFRHTSLESPFLLASGRPVIGVIRIEGQIEQFDEKALLAGVQDTLERARAAGLPLAGIEIDHDCATARLPRYTAFLRNLRAALTPNLPLSITALPAWMESPALPALLAEANEAVLQVHAVVNPRSGLFDPQQASRWIEDFARISPHPFRVALPTYGSRLNFDAWGNLAGVESEMPLLAGAARSEEAIVSPLAVQSLLHALAQHRPPQLVGIVWFRLPTTNDQRAWQASTWRALMRGDALPTQLETIARPGSDPQRFDLLLRNPADVDIETPHSLTLPAHCTLTDGANGYLAMTDAQDKHGLQRAQSALLQPRHEIIIGWARCAHNPEPDIHVQP
jgi:hypothetical protein